jgi:hypothetical protein
VVIREVNPLSWLWPWPSKLGKSKTWLTKKKQTSTLKPELKPIVERKKREERKKQRFGHMPSAGFERPSASFQVLLSMVNLEGSHHGYNGFISSLLDGLES